MLLLSPIPTKRIRPSLFVIVEERFVKRLAWHYLVVLFTWMTLSVAAFSASPTITSLSPTSGAVGTSVTINGSNFATNQGSSTVKFSGVTTTPTSWSSTKIVAPVPNGTTTGNVVVTVSNKASNGVSFTVTPGITSLSPNSAGIGVSITITGTTFGSTQGSSTVKFNGTSAAPTSWSTSQIVVPVPTGATSGNVVVTVGGSASNGVAFTVVNGGYLAGSLVPTPFSWSPTYSPINFSDPEVIDWVHWGLSGGTSVDRKSGANVISSLTIIGPDSPTQYTSCADHFTWNNGNVNPTVSDACSGLYLMNQGDGFQLTVPADTTPKTLKLYVGVQGASGTLQASMSDNSVVPFVDSVGMHAGEAQAGTYSIAFRAASAGQLLTVKYTANISGYYLLIEGVELTPKHPDVTVTQPSVDENFTAPASFTSSAQSSEVASTISSVSLFNNGNSVGTLTSAPYNFNINNIAAGNYDFTAEAVDASGRSQMSLPIPIHVVGSGGELSASVATPPSTVNLTQQGTADWVLYGRQGFGNQSPPNFDRKASVGPLISVATRINWGFWYTYGDNLVTYTAEDGTQSFGPQTTGIFSSDPAAGFQLAITAGLTEHTASIYVGAWQAQGQFEAYLSDGTAPVYVDTSTDTADHINHVYTIKYHAASEGQQLVIQYTLLTNHSYGNVTLQAVTVDGTPIPAVPSISSISPISAPVNSQVRIFGTNFGATQGAGEVTFNGTPARVTAWTNSEIDVLAPAGLTSGPVVVTVGGATSNSVLFTLQDTFRLVPSATVLSLGQQRQLQLLGTDGNPVLGASWSIDNSQAVTLSTDDPPIITATAPGAVTVTATSGNNTATAIIQVASAAPADNPNVPTDSGTSDQLLTMTTQITDSAGHQSTYSSSYVGGHRAIYGTAGPGCSSCGGRGQNSFTYDANGNRTSQTDALGHTTSYTYDTDGNVLSISRQVDPNTTQTWHYTYNTFGQILTATDPLGNTTTNQYDGNGNLLSVTAPAPDANTPASVTKFGYNSLGELTSVTDPLSHLTQMTYTPEGLLATVEDAQNQVTRFEYDPAGNRTAIVDAKQNRTAFTYDLMNRLTGIIHPDKTTNSFLYDSRGRRTSTTDGNGNVTGYTYDDADRMTVVTDASHNTTQYGYDNENNLISITDALSRMTTFSYDNMGRVTQSLFPSQLAEGYTYDVVGNLLTKNDRNQHTITYSYDNLNRMYSKQYPDSTSVNYTHDLADRLTQVSDATGTYGFSYDNMGRLTGTTTQYSVLSGQTFTNAYTYDAASNRIGFTAPDGTTSTYVYDTLNRLSGLTNSITGQFGFGYDELGRRTSLTRPNGVNTSYNYDSLSRLLSVLHKAGGATIDGASYTYDNAGNRLSKLNQLNGVTENYTYDPLYQLKQVQQIVNGNQTTSESYTYDIVGNRLSSLNVASYSYNTSNQLTSSADGYNYTYDNNGNTLTKSNSSGTTQYGWDFENRLTSVTLPNGGGAVSYRYDSLGRRIQKTSSSGTTNYVYDGVNTLEELDQSGNVAARYAQEPLRVDAVLSMLRGGSTSLYQQDGINSVTSVSNAAAALAQTYTFNTFGNLMAASGSLTNPYQYAGREFDSETGLLYLRARYYDPTVGRFIGEDPIRFGPNFYNYANNSPLKWIDPLGLSPQDVQTIVNAINNAIANMTANGQRRGGDTLNGELNNIMATLNMVSGGHLGKPYLGCGDQTDEVIRKVTPLIPKLDAPWTIDKVSDFTPLYHQFGVMTSSDPNDPIIVFDPLNNVVQTVPNRPAPFPEPIK